eukprot:15460925-Alexandrium_andersonii.AAC.1
MRHELIAVQASSRGRQPHIRRHSRARSANNDAGAHASTKKIADRHVGLAYDPAGETNTHTHTHTRTLFAAHGRASSAAVQRESSHGTRSNREVGDQSAVDSKPPCGR